MKKHIFGFALFCFIFLSFVLASAFFYAPPIPQIAQVAVPVFGEESLIDCEEPMKSTGISHEIISSYFFYDESKIVSKIRVLRNRREKAPAKIYITARYSAVVNIAERAADDVKILENPFVGADEQIVTITSLVSNRDSIDKDANIYMFINVTDRCFPLGNSGDATETKQVVFVHGETSIIRK